MASSIYDCIKSLKISYFVFSLESWSSHYDTLLLTLSCNDILLLAFYEIK